MSRPDPLDLKLMDLAKKALIKHGVDKTSMGVPRIDLRIGEYMIRTWASPGRRITIFQILVSDEPDWGANQVSVWSMDLDTRELTVGASPHRQDVIDLLLPMMVLETLADIEDD